MRILVADDDEVSLTIVAETLRSAGYEVTTAKNGAEALDGMHREDCRLLVTDWEMPKLNGIQLCEAVRQEDHDGYVYVILLTCRGTVEERVEGLSAGADDFISKPFEPRELLARVATGERILALETRDVAIFALARLAESRDPETGAHLERVRSYSRVLAQELAKSAKHHDVITAEYIRLIYLTSPLHDIGKVGIPDSVLLKPGRLSDNEFDIMKSHTTIAAETLDAALERFPNVRFLLMARDIACSHHERFDGTGYPSGLRADAIPLCARIVALADVYDALTSKRVYKSAMTHHIAKPIILEGAGNHFDPDVVAAFEATEPQFIAIADRYREVARIAA